MRERWKDITGYGGRYQISSLGRVKSFNPKRGELIMKTRLRNGYPSVTLMATEAHSIHVLVAEAFIGPRPEGQVVRHLDGDKENPASSNLAYGTHADNEADKALHGTKQQGSSHHQYKHGKQIRREVKRLKDSGKSFRAVAEAVQLPLSTVSYIYRQPV